jgi:hypothetical protein
MKTDSEDFINCAMSVFEEGIAVQGTEIEEECSCRLGLSNNEIKTIIQNKGE